MMPNTFSTPSFCNMRAMTSPPVISAMFVSPLSIAIMIA